MIEEEGIEAVWARHDRLARAVWAAVRGLGAGGADAPRRSPTRPPGRAP